MGTNQYMQLGNASFQGTQAALELYNAYRLNQKLKGMDDTYRIPTEIGQNLSEANQRALQGLPQEQKQEYLNNLQRSNAYSLSSLGDLNAGIRGVAGANEQFNQGNENLLAQDSAARANNQNAVYGFRQNMADYKDMAWKHNVDNPYWAVSNKKDAYFTAAGRDASKASNNLAGAFSMGGKQSEPNGGATSGVDATQYYGMSGKSPYNPNYVAPQQSIPTQSGFSMVNPEGTFGNTYGNYGSGNSYAQQYGSGNSYAEQYWGK